MADNNTKGPSRLYLDAARAAGNDYGKLKKGFFQTQGMYERSKAKAGVKGNYNSLTIEKRREALAECMQHVYKLVNSLHVDYTPARGDLYTSRPAAPKLDPQKDALSAGGVTPYLTYIDHIIGSNELRAKAEALGYSRQDLENIRAVLDKEAGLGFGKTQVDKMQEHDDIQAHEGAKQAGITATDLNNLPTKIQQVQRLDLKKVPAALSGYLASCLIAAGYYERIGNAQLAQQATSIISSSIVPTVERLSANLSNLGDKVLYDALTKAAESKLLDANDISEYKAQASNYENNAARYNGKKSTDPDNVAVDTATGIIGSAMAKLGGSK